MWEILPMKRARLIALAVLALAGCGDPLPSGEPALREALGAMSAGKPFRDGGAALATDMAKTTIDLTSGFAGEDLRSQWDEARIADKVDAALAPNEQRLEDAFYASLAKSVPAETTGQLVADTRNPAKLAALQCAYRPNEMRFELGTCDMEAMGKPGAWGPRYIALKQGMDTAADDPTVLGIIGSAACDVSDEFLNAARKANPNFFATDPKITKNGKTYDCAAFRKMAAPGAKG
jgi:hypothetical protein